MKSIAKCVMPSPVAGSWYPDDPAALRTEILNSMKSCTNAVDGPLCALILPHAGYRFSGAVAAAGVKQIPPGRFGRVVLLAPTHRLPMRNAVAIPDAVTHFGTPLGDVPLDLDALERLAGRPGFVRLKAAHAEEHASHIEIPLLQVAMKGFTLAPVIVGELDLETASSVAASLRTVIGPDTLVVVSSDFTHYGPNYDYVPFGDPVEENLRKLDMGAFEAIRGKSPRAFADYVSKTGATICGRNAILVLLNLLPESAGVQLVTYDTSGRMTGDFRNSVSYLAIACTGRWPPPAPQPSGREPAGASEGIPEADRKALLALARSTIDFCFKHRRAPASADDLSCKPSDAVRRPSGVFVTLKKKGGLRGCIGSILPVRPLYEAVIANAVNSAFRDTRFEQLQPDEWPDIEIEISVLTPPRAVPSHRDIVIGRHGMILSKEGRSAVFLPQVAPEQGWGLDETLTHLSMKAGLPPDAWKEGASFEVFEAIVFHEEKKETGDGRQETGERR